MVGLSGGQGRPPEPGKQPVLIGLLLSQIDNYPSPGVSIDGKLTMRSG